MTAFDKIVFDTEGRIFIADEHPHVPQNEWNYPGIGNWCKPLIVVKNSYQGAVSIQLGVI
jgi:hypothetical protein